MALYELDKNQSDIIKYDATDGKITDVSRGTLALCQAHAAVKSWDTGFMPGPRASLLNFSDELPDDREIVVVLRPPLPFAADIKLVPYRPRNKIIGLKKNLLPGIGGRLYATQPDLG